MFFLKNKIHFFPYLNHLLSLIVADYLQLFLQTLPVYKHSNDGCMVFLRAGFHWAMPTMCVTACFHNTQQCTCCMCGAIHCETDSNAPYKKCNA